MHTKNSIAHETGHVIIGPGHPNDGAGAAPLPGLEQQAYKRLMVSGDAGRGGEHARMLTKAEWDEIERWLKKEEDDGRLQN